MTVYNTTTEQVETLNLAAYDTDVMTDIIGNHRFEGFDYNDEREMHESDEENIAWWREWITNEDAANELESEFLDHHTKEELYELYSDELNVDLEDQPKVRIALLKEALAQ